MTLKADPAAQVRLLDVQELDSTVDQLRHRRASLPELAEIAKLETSRAGLADRVRDARIVVDDLTVELRKAESDVEQVRARRARDRDRMDQGLITNAKDLQRMTHELESLERRVSTLEDAELELMERMEQAQQELARAEEEIAATDARLADLAASQAEKESEIEAELQAVVARRGPAVQDLPADLLALYDKLRQAKGGMGAALLRARQCGGCRLTVDPQELARIKAAPADDVIRCEECQRILVRTSESGLGGRQAGTGD
ncbi:zinc ribbon domain-containing protein [Nocardioides campestrisoli]|uniref:zinc ribbon domain-containing protein n=1 Tax=Nocardioides campestrisoli TaxID=2736757 RepID=UPI001CD2EE4C|nr:C4-type zinc ribbon domain-containing protein [Nocardioides campestrisoli]